MSLVILNVGATKTGKTTRAIDKAENFLQKSRIRAIFANDRQKEYKYRINKKVQLHRGSHAQWDNILLNTNDKAFTVCFICDEAGDYLLKSLGKQITKEPMRGKRFNGNVYIINFHAFNEIPSYVWRFADYIMISKTTEDTEKQMRAALTGKEHIVEAWLRCMKHPTRWYDEQLEIHI